MKGQLYFNQILYCLRTDENGNYKLTECPANLTTCEVCPLLWACNLTTLILKPTRVKWLASLMLLSYLIFSKIKLNLHPLQMKIGAIKC